MGIFPENENPNSDASFEKYVALRYAEEFQEASDPGDDEECTICDLEGVVPIEFLGI